MIKIIHALTDTNFGGAGMWLLNYLKAYDKEKYDVSVALPKNAILTPIVRKLNVKVHEIDGIADMSYSKRGISEFKKLFISQKPDIIHCHASLSARIAAKQLKIKTVNTRHCLEDPKSFPKNIVYGMINNSLSDIVVAVSKASLENLLKDGTKKEKLRLVYNGVFPPEKLSEEKRMKIKTKFLNIPENNIVIGMIARLEPVKNHALFLQSVKLLFEKHDNISVLIVGGGSKEQELKALSKKLGIDNKVIFTGYQSHIEDFLNVIDIMALTSEKEALSLSLIEGMCLEKPGVATRSGGPCEVIEDGKTGILVENHNEKALADAFSRLINDEALRKTMGANGKKRAKDIFSTEKMIDSLDKIYQELLKK